MPGRTAHDVTAPRRRQEIVTALAGSMHDLIQTTVMTDADEQELMRVNEAVQALTARLRPELTPAQYRDGYLCSGRRTANPFDSPRNPMTAPIEVVEWADGLCVLRIEHGPAHEGPPGRVHGGVVAGVLDNVCGRSTASLGLFAMSVELDVRFLAPTPYAEPLIARGEVIAQEGRRITVDGTLRTASGEITARARALFIRIDDAAAPGKPMTAELSPIE